MRHSLPGDSSLTNEDDASQAHIHRELDYLDQLLAKATPHSNSRGFESADVVAIATRVARRFRKENPECEVIFERPYEEIRALIGEVDLERILTNVVGNAVKHSRGTHVIIEGDTRGDDARVRVIDNGVGITCFDREGAQDPSGWGIGIQICEEMARSSGGTISVNPSPGSGTEVVVSLRRAVSAPRAEEAPLMTEGSPSYGESRGGIFIVDDDTEQMRSLQRALAQRGFKTRTASSVDRLFQDCAVSDASLVLCDMHMPGGGVERLLKELKRIGQKPKVAVVSGDLSDEALYRVAALGASAAFVKPLDIDEVCRWLREGRA